jgi:hypothetical protein
MLDQRQLIRDAVRLRRAHLRHPHDEDLAAVRLDLERAGGPTVGRAASARLLGVSQTALDRWIAAGEVPVVLTPNGRREVPFDALVSLIEDVERRRDERRPLAAVLRARRASGERTPSLVHEAAPGHRGAELRGLAYHRAVARQLDERIVGDALARLRRWREDGRIHPHYADRWHELLTGPRPWLAEAIARDDDDAVALRQSSPFAGALGEHERRRAIGVQR